MRVVVASPFVPWPLADGGSIRTFHLLRHAAREVDVTLLAVSSGADDPQALGALREAIGSVEILPRSKPSLLRTLTRAKIERWFASEALERRLAQIDRNRQADLFELLELPVARTAPSGLRTPVLLQHHKLDTDLFARLAGERPSAAQRFDLAKLRRLERSAARLHPHHLTCSAEDRALLLERYPDLDIAVLPSGYDPDHFHPDGTTRDPHTVLFLGSLSYGPNVDGLRWFVDRIWPSVRERRPQTRLQVVGREPAPEVQALASDSIEIVGPVPDVRPYLRAAACLAVPLRVGGGTRLKIVEAMGTATPVLSTRVGAEGLELTDGQELRLADSPEAFAGALLQLLDDPREAAALGRRGLTEAEHRFQWSALAARLVACWRRVAAGQRAVTEDDREPTLGAAAPRP
ncbi:MAG: glycosyltransferase [Planctomycetota bacterium]